MLCVREETAETSESTHRNLTKSNGELEGVPSHSSGDKCKNRITMLILSYIDKEIKKYNFNEKSRSYRLAIDSFSFI